MTRFHAGASEIKLQPSAAESQAPTGGVRDVTGLRVLTFFFPDEAALTARFKEHGYPAPEFRNRTPAAERPAWRWFAIPAINGSRRWSFPALPRRPTIASKSG